MLENRLLEWLEFFTEQVTLRKSNSFRTSSDRRSKLLSSEVINEQLRSEPKAESVKRSRGGMSRMAFNLLGY